MNLASALSSLRNTNGMSVCFVLRSVCVFAFISCVIEKVYLRVLFWDWGMEKSQGLMSGDHFVISNKKCEQVWAISDVGENVFSVVINIYQPREKYRCPVSDVQNISRDSFPLPVWNSYIFNNFSQVYLLLLGTISLNFQIFKQWTYWEAPKLSSIVDVFSASLKDL